MHKCTRVPELKFVVTTKFKDDVCVHCVGITVLLYCGSANTLSYFVLFFNKFMSSAVLLLAVYFIRWTCTGHLPVHQNEEHLKPLIAFVSGGLFVMFLFRYSVSCMFVYFQGCVCINNAAPVQAHCDPCGPWKLSQCHTDTHGQEYCQTSHLIIYREW